MKTSNSSVADSVSLVRIAVDFLLVAAVGITVLLLPIFASPFRRGFFCDDDSIRFPHKENTVPTALVGVASLGLPIVMVTLSELLESRSDMERQRRKMVLRWPVPLWVRSWCRTVCVFLFGAGVSHILVETAKYSVGRLRPHFLNVCLPDVDCNTPGIALHDYIDSYECTGTDTDLIQEARLSFPSGHSALSFYAATFSVMYLENVMTWRGSVLLKHCLQVAFVLAAWLTALSRVSDFMHHWSDVLAGMCIGVLSALLMVSTARELRSSWCCLLCSQTEKLTPCDGEEDGHGEP